MEVVPSTGLSGGAGSATEMARTERDGERQFRALLESVPDAIFITDDAGLIEFANLRVDTLFRHARESLAGTSISALLPAWRSPAPDQQAPSCEQRMDAVRSDGSTFPSHVIVLACPDPERTMYTTTVRAATELTAAEERIRDLNRLNLELEARVQERTIALNRSNDALRQFAWAASHDLQEPVRTVVAYSEWLHDSTGNALGEREARMLNVIRQHGERLHRLLGALREYIRVNDPAAHLPSRVDSRAAAAAAASSLQSLIDQSGAVVEYGDLPHIESVEMLLVQLFQKLIGNAIRYRGPDPPCIRISASRDDTGWIFSVEDNGIGIEERHFAYIFGVFRRLQGGERPGAGVGLAICKAAVERLGGRIWVESKPGNGSSFRFLLPHGSRTNETDTYISG